MRYNLIDREIEINPHRRSRVGGFKKRELLSEQLALAAKPRPALAAEPGAALTLPIARLND